MKKISCIYEIKNIKNGKRYVGQTKDFVSRKRRHIGNLRSNKHKNDHLQSAWNLYGEECFEFSIIEECDIEKLDDREIYWINFYDSFHNGYNLCEGGNGQISRNLSEYSKQKISMSKKGKNKGKLGREHTEEELLKMHLASKAREWNYGNNPNSVAVVCLNTGEVFDSIQRASDCYNVNRIGIIESCKNGHSVNGLFWMHYDIYITKTKEEIDEYINYRTYVNKHRRSKPVMCVNTREVFPSASEAAQKYGLDNSTLSKCCRGILKFCGKDKDGNKLSWIYID